MGWLSIFASFQTCFKINRPSRDLDQEAPDFPPLAAQFWDLLIDSINFSSSKLEVKRVRKRKKSKKQTSSNGNMSETSKSLGIKDLKIKVNRRIPRVRNQKRRKMKKKLKPYTQIFPYFEVNSLSIETPNELLLPFQHLQENQELLCPGEI